MVRLNLHFILNRKDLSAGLGVSLGCKLEGKIQAVCSAMSEETIQYIEFKNQTATRIVVCALDFLRNALS